MMRSGSANDQHGFEVRLGWGIDGLQALSDERAVVVIVDVLSFSTSVDVAVGRGAAVLPFGGGSGEVGEYAEKHDAVAAGPRTKGGSGWSLSPASLLSIDSGTRLVLPSPNGSLLSATAATVGTTLTACLRNAPAVGAALEDFPPLIAVIAAGERWGHGHGRLRPAVEDLIGAGAVITALGSLFCSPEARAARAAFEAAEPALDEWMRTCSSGRELVDSGFAADVEIAAQYGSSSTVPVLEDGAFVDQQGA